MINKEAVLKFANGLNKVFSSLVEALESDNYNATEKIFKRTALQMSDIAFKNMAMIDVNYSEDTMYQIMIIRITTITDFEVLASIEDIELYETELVIQCGSVYFEIPYDDILFIERISTFNSDLSELISDPESDTITRTIIYQQTPIKEGGEMIDV